MYVRIEDGEYGRATILQELPEGLYGNYVALSACR